MKFLRYRGKKGYFNYQAERDPVWWLGLIGMLLLYGLTLR
jgi:hypothetical protein